MQRVQSPTPKFFRTVRSIGLILTAASAAVLTAPVSLPAIVLTVAGYVAVAGAVMSAVSQTTVETEDPLSAASSDDNGGGTASTGRL